MSHNTLGVVSNENNYSFIKFYDEWKIANITAIETFRELPEKLNLSEAADSEYNGMPLNVYVGKVPIITGGDATVKVLYLEQANSAAIVLPQEIPNIYKKLESNPEAIKSVNLNLELYVEILGFDSNDNEFEKIVKKLYLSTLDSSPAFELTKEEKEDNIEGDERGSQERNSGRPPVKPDFSPEDTFGGVAGDAFEEEPEIKDNMESYKKFKNQTGSMDKLLFELTKHPTIVKENLKIKYLGENKNVLVIEQDNENIYGTFVNLPKAAKSTMTRIGETIRKFKGVQLVDSFIKNNKRYFVIAEYAGNNYWVSEEDSIDEKPLGKKIESPIQEDIIILKKSSVRPESRKIVPHSNGKSILFSHNEIK